MIPATTWALRELEDNLSEYIDEHGKPIADLYVNAHNMQKEQMIDFAAYCIEHYGDKKVRKMGLYEMFDEYRKLPF